jgi:cell division protein FtsB
MATRRPKVPRAAPAAPKSPETGDGGDVIQADFRGHAASPVHGHRQDGPRPEAGRAASGKAATDRQSPSTGPGGAGATKTGSAGAGATKAGSAGAGATMAAGRQGATSHAGSGRPPARQEEAPVPAKAFSGRLLALAVVMIAITIMLAPTVKIFFEKRAEIAALQADISAKQSQQNDLRRQVSRWQDPNYVKQQARDRINMVMPGETGYWVFGSDLPAGDTGGAAGAAASQDPAKLPWVDTLWESIRRSATD